MRVPFVARMIDKERIVERRRAQYSELKSEVIERFRLQDPVVLSAGTDSDFRFVERP
ncbi:MAG: hypothetical protein IID45_10545 [Planctomycetes bacterium]|nr:hypothetical protein [Planctomycetota bacterium]